MNEFEEAVKQVHPFACCREASTHFGPQKLGPYSLHSVYRDPSADAVPMGTAWSEAGAWQVAYTQMILDSAGRATVARMLNEMNCEELWGRLSDDNRRRLYAFVTAIEGSG
jgi:hypothetical protein